MHAGIADVLQTDPHGLLVKSGFFPDPPPQVDGLKAATMLHAQLAQFGEHLSLQGIPLLLEITKGGADEDAEGFARLCHQLLPADSSDLWLFIKASTQSLKCLLASSGGGGASSGETRGTGSIKSKPRICSAHRHSFSTHSDF